MGNEHKGMVGVQCGRILKEVLHQTNRFEYFNIVGDECRILLWTENLNWKRTPSSQDLEFI